MKGPILEHFWAQGQTEVNFNLQFTANEEECCPEQFEQSKSLSRAFTALNWCIKISIMQLT